MLTLEKTRTKNLTMSEAAAISRIESKPWKASMRRVEDMVCRICEGMDAIAGDSVQVQNLKGRKIVTRRCVKE